MRIAVGVRVCWLAKERVDDYYQKSSGYSRLYVWDDFGGS